MAIISQKQTAASDTRPGNGGGSQLTRTTVNLTPHAVAALDRMVSARPGGPNRTDLINRGVQVLELFEQLLDRNGGRLTVKHDDGTEETIYVIG